MKDWGLSGLGEKGGNINMKMGLGLLTPGLTPRVISTAMAEGFLIRTPTDFERGLGSAQAG